MIHMQIVIAIIDPNWVQILVLDSENSIVSMVFSWRYVELLPFYTENLADFLTGKLLHIFYV